MLISRLDDDKYVDFDSNFFENHRTHHPLNSSPTSSPSRQNNFDHKNLPTPNQSPTNHNPPPFPIRSRKYPNLFSILELPYTKLKEK